MRSVTLAAFALALLGAGCGIFTRPPPAGYRLPREEAALSQALARFAQALALEAEVGRADGAALEAYGAAAGLDPGTPMLGDLFVSGLLRQGRVDEALAELQRRCDATPSVEAHVTLARVAEIAGRHDLALRHFERAARLSPDAAEWRHAQVRVLFELRRDREALRRLRPLCLPAKGAPDPAAPYYWALRFVERDKQPERGLPLLGLALACATNHRQRAQIRDVTALAELYRGNTNAARRAFRAAAAEDLSDVERAGRAAHFDRLVWGDDATNRWQQALQANPADLTSLLALAQEASRRRQWSAARAGLLRARELCRELAIAAPAPSFYSMLGHVLEEAGDPDAAENSLREGLAAHEGNAELLNHLAYFWAVHDKRLAEAEQLVAEALRQEPQNGAFIDTLGWVYYRQARHDEALAQLSLAARLEPGDPTILDHLGDTLFALGREAEALAYWRLSLRADPESPEVAAKLRRHGGS